jgi:hypothetical protein
MARDRLPKPSRTARRLAHRARLAQGDAVVVVECQFPTSGRGRGTVSGWNAVELRLDGRESHWFRESLFRAPVVFNVRNVPRVVDIEVCAGGDSLSESVPLVSSARCIVSIRPATEWSPNGFGRSGAYMFVTIVNPAKNLPRP